MVESKPLCYKADNDGEELLSAGSRDFVILLF